MPPGGTDRRVLASHLARPATIADRVYEALREAIVFGELPPGQRLLERELALQLGASRTPVREALRRLAEDGLVSGEPNRGLAVRTLTLEEAEHVYAVREPLEILACRLAARRCSPRQLAILERCILRARRAARASDWRRVILENNAFHDEIAAASGNFVLTRILGLLRNQVNLVRMALWARQPDRPYETFREHWQILEALRSRNPEAAASAGRAHLRSSWRSLCRALRGEDVR